jgi:hypothetical protein
MRGFRLSSIVVVALLAGFAAPAIVMTSGSAKADASTVTLIEKQINKADVLADVPPFAGKNGEPSKGDSYLFRKKVYDATGAHRVGSLAVRCTFLKVTKRFIGTLAICDGIYTLRNGTISLALRLKVTHSLVTTFAVTGGTGAYDGARGTGTSTGRSSTSNTSDVVINLLP